jgi:hypothetical protein
MPMCFKKNDLFIIHSLLIEYQKLFVISSNAFNFDFYAKNAIKMIHLLYAQIILIAFFNKKLKA